MFPMISRKVPSVWILLPLLLTACSPRPGSGPDTATLAAIDRVENGLLPAVLFEDTQPWTLAGRMEHYGVPGVGIAVIDSFEIAWARGYGVMDTETGEPVTAGTLFQAASISKTLNATAVMKEAELGRLSLEDPVNRVLRSWRLPDHAWSAESPVTIANLLSHTGGTTIRGFPGYPSGQPLPTTIQILDGEPPANTDPVVVTLRPGQRYRYSGGGITVLQLLLTEIEGEPYPDLMKRLVLDPAGMGDSTFRQPLPAELIPRAASAHGADGRPVAGRYHVYPEMAAAGLWTTPSDLCRFAIEHQLSLQSRSNRILSADSEKRMITPYIADRYGLGFGVEHRGGQTWFLHNGGNVGFNSILIAHADAGCGVAVMINANGMPLIDEIVRAVAAAYDWPGYLNEPVRKFALSDSGLERCVGRYRMGPDEVVTIARDGDLLRAEVPGDRTIGLVPVSETQMQRTDREGRVEFSGPEDRAGSLTLLEAGLTLPRLAEDEWTPFELMASGRPEEGLAAYRALSEAGETEALDEGRLNRLGYRLLGEGKVDAAVGLFGLNAELYPSSANVWDSLGEALLAAGLVERAVTNYEKVLELSPGNDHALQMLEKIRAEHPGAGR